MKKTKKNKDFIGTLRNILENNEFLEIIQFLKEKNGFKIMDLQKFKSDILIKYFSHNNYSSFRRQLNMYGFQQHKSNKQEVTYINESFNFETDKKVKKYYRKMEQQSENIEYEQKQQWNQLLQIQQNQKKMMEQINTIIKTQEQMREKMKSQLSDFIQKRFKSEQRDKFLFLALTLYTNIKDQNFSIILNILEQYIDDLIQEENSFPLFNYLKHQLIRNTTILFQLINYYFNKQTTNSNSIDQSFLEQDLEDKLSLSNISNYFDL